jgi:transcriptional regulator with XRE-family HTH domain
VSIGAALAESRQQAGLTLAQVSEQTRIRETVIREIECDDYTGCGGDFYARGHIRGIAKAVGTDPAPLVEEYNAICRSADVLSRVSLEELLAISAQAPQRRRPPVPAAWGLVAAARSSLRHQGGSRVAREPLGSAARSPWRRWGWTVALAMALVVALGFGLYSLVGGPRQPTIAPSAAGKRVVTPQRAGPSQPNLMPQRSHAAASRPPALAMPVSRPPAPAVPARTSAPVTGAASRSSGGGHFLLAHHAVAAHRAAAVVGRSARGRHRHHREFGRPGPGNGHGGGNGNGEGHGKGAGNGDGGGNGNGNGDGN